MGESEKADVAELRAEAKMNGLKVEALLNILAKEGIVSRDDFEDELAALCEKGSDPGSSR